MKNNLLKGLMFVCAVVLSTSAFSKRLNNKQRKDLFVKGSITTEKGTFLVKFMPGAQYINRHATKRGIGNSVDAVKSYGDEYFLEDMKDSFNSGVEFAFEDSWGNYWWNGITRDSKDLGKLMASKDNFGGVVGKAIGSGWWLVKVAGRTVLAPIGTAAGLGYAVGAPVYDMVSPPVKAAWHLGVDAVIIPASLYVWNGTAWVLTSWSKVPQNSGYLVQLVSDKVASRSLDLQNRAPLVLTVSDADALLENTVSSIIKDKKIRVLRDEIDSIESDYSKNNKEGISILRDSWTRDVVLEEGEVSKFVINDQFIADAVKRSLASKGVASPSTDLVNEMVKSYKKTVRDMITKK